MFLTIVQDKNLRKRLIFLCSIELNNSFFHIIKTVITNKGRSTPEALNKIESYHDQHFFDPCFVALIPCYLALHGLSQEAPHLLDLDGTAAAAAAVGLPQDLVHTNIPKQVPGPIQKTRDKTSNEWHLGRRCPGKKETQYCYFSR